jgi:hypothetical protein
METVCVMDCPQVDESSEGIVLTGVDGLCESVRVEVLEMVAWGLMTRDKATEIYLEHLMRWLRANQAAFAREK